MGSHLGLLYVSPRTKVIFLHIYGSTTYIQIMDISYDGWMYIYMYVEYYVCTSISSHIVLITLPSVFLRHES
jgi:hypothetical protein